MGKLQLLYEVNSSNGDIAGGNKAASGIYEQ